MESKARLIHRTYLTYLPPTLPVDYPMEKFISFTPVFTRSILIIRDWSLFLQFTKNFCLIIKTKNF